MTQDYISPRMSPALRRALDNAASGQQSFAQSVGAILIITDDPSAPALAQTLEEAGHTVTLAPDSLHALELVLLTKECPFDLVLVETRMTGFSGKDICRVIRQKYRRNDLSVILLADPAHGDDPIEALRCGADDYVTRPFRDEEVKVRIGLSLDLLYSHRELANQYSQLQAQQNHLVDQEKMAALGLLSAGIAHEIHNPNYYLKAAVEAAGTRLKKFRQFLDELLEDDNNDELRADFDQQVNDILRQLETAREGSHRISEIVSSMRDMSKGDDGETRLIDPLESLLSTVRLVRMNYKHDIDFEYRLEARAQIMGRLAQVNQVFLNLLINACQAIEDRLAGGAAIRGRIVLHSVIHDEELLVAIEDNGSGIPDDIQDKLFTPFFTTKDGHRGTGLGLSICRKILDEHNSSLDFQSVEGEGTMMTLRFPIAR